MDGECFNQSAFRRLNLCDDHIRMFFLKLLQFQMPDRHAVGHQLREVPVDTDGSV